MDERTGAGTPERTALDLLVVPGLLVLVVTAARLPILTPDVWWHLATGRFIVASGIPHVDPFSYTLVGQRWTAHEWLADLLLYGVYSGAGLLGIVLARGALLGAAFAAAYAASRLRAGALPALATLGLAAYASQRNWIDRPQLLSFVLAPLLLWALERNRLRPSRTIFLLPLLFVAWVNLHGGFMLGLGMVAMWTVGGAWEAWRHRREESATGLRRLGAVFALCVLATLVNPNGIEGAVYPLHYIRAGLGATLREEQPGTLNSPYALVHLALVLALWGLFLARRRAPLAHVGLGIVLGWISMPRFGGIALPFSAERHAPLFLLLGTPMVAWQLAPLLERHAKRWEVGRRTLATRRAWMGAAALSAAAGVGALAALPRDGRPDARLLPGRFPIEAAAWLRTERLPGNLINPYRWGGYLAFTLYPPTQVWIDSRGDLYGSARLEESQMLNLAPPGSDAALGELLQRYDANVIVWPLVTAESRVRRVHPFVEFLLRSGEWRLVFYDRPDPHRPEERLPVSTVFVREHPRNAAWLWRYPSLPLPLLPQGMPPGATPP